jgi:hypothetical protein
MISMRGAGYLLALSGLALACAGSSGAPSPGPPEPAPSPVPSTAPPMSPPTPRARPEPELQPIPDYKAPDPRAAEREAPSPAPPSPAPPPGAEPLSPPRPDSSGAFPSPRELEELGEPPGPAQVFDLDTRRVERWRLRGPFPDKIGALPYQAEDRWSQVLAEEAGRRPGLLLPTEAMRCVARELGLFYLEHRGQPTESLRRFITVRCHASVPQVRMAHFSADISPGADEAQVFEELAPRFRENLGRALAGGSRTAGLWYGRKGGHVVVILAWGQRRIHLEPVSPFADPAGGFSLEGEVLEPVVGINALINRGRFAVESCKPDETVALPRFRFLCQADTRDPQALVSVSLRAPDRLLASNGLDALVWPGRFTSNEYRNPKFGKRRLVTEEDPVAEEFVALLNEARKEAGLEPVELDRDQSAAAQRLTPFFFASMQGQGPSLHTEMIVLGMIAGWSVQGAVESGHFTAAWVMRSTDLAELLGSALEYPVSREALLASDIDRIAVGGMLATAEGLDGMAALIGTYAVFSGGSQDELTTRVLEQLTAARAARGQGPPRELVELASLCEGAAIGVESGESPEDVLNALLKASVQVLRRPVTGMITEVTDLSAVSLPDEYLDEPGLSLAVVVTHEKRPGEPRGRYVVMIVFASEGLGA